MASYSDTRLVSIRDNLLAPTIFFESVPVSGYGDGIVTITLNVFCPQVGPNGELRGQAATTAYLKCSVHGAVNLREAINNALARAQRPPETTAQATKVRNVRTTISDKAVPCPLNHVNRAVPCAKAECPLGLGLHLRRNLGGLRLRRLRHRRLRPSHRGWRVSRTAHASFVLDAREQASMIGGRSIAAGSYITATEAAKASRSSIPSGWWRRASSLRWVASATVMTMLSPR